ncbi:MAG: toll/interleukin-1 receptor domain-containing protein [Pseudomonadota bacterium]|nr:toll/interleukin-1 receptor domain-containing protein [Pseudomonadota bacterium]
MATRDVFVSYSQPDRDCAFQLVAQLESRGIGVWVAPRDISPAADWAEEIIDAISASRLMVLVFSAHCNASPQVRREVERAVHRQIPVLPFRIEEVLPARSLEYFLSTPHWLDAFPPPREPHYARLGAHIVSLLNSSAAADMTSGVSDGTPTSVPLGLTGGLPVSTSSGVPKIVSGTGGFPSPSERDALVLDAADSAWLERRLAHHVGPIARYLVQRAASRAVNREEFTQMLAAEVEAVPARNEFIDACRDGRPTR